VLGRLAELTSDGIEPGLRTRIVELSGGRACDPDHANRFGPKFDHDPATEEDEMLHLGERARRRSLVSLRVVKPLGLVLDGISDTSW